MTDLLDDILDWCSAHPETTPLPESGDLIMHRHADGSISVEGDAPEHLAISAELLDTASSDYVAFADGVLTLNVKPGPLRYRPLGPDPRSHMVVFERVNAGEGRA